MKIGGSHIIATIFICFFLLYILSLAILPPGDLTPIRNGNPVNVEANEAAFAQFLAKYPEKVDAAIATRNRKYDEALRIYTDILEKVDLPWERRYIELLYARTLMAAGKEPEEAAKILKRLATDGTASGVMRSTAALDLARVRTAYPEIDVAPIVFSGDIFSDMAKGGEGKTVDPYLKLYAYANSQYRNANALLLAANAHLSRLVEFKRGGDKVSEHPEYLALTQEINRNLLEAKNATAELRSYDALELTDFIVASRLLGSAKSKIVYLDDPFSENYTGGMNTDFEEDFRTALSLLARWGEPPIPEEAYTRLTYAAALALVYGKDREDDISILTNEVMAWDASFADTPVGRMFRSGGVRSFPEIERSMILVGEVDQEFGDYLRGYGWKISK